MLPCNGFRMVWAIVVEEEGGRCYHLGDDEGYENRPYQRRHEQIHDHSLILRIWECKGMAASAGDVYHQSINRHLQVYRFRLTKHKNQHILFHLRLFLPSPHSNKTHRPLHPHLSFPPLASPHPISHSKAFIMFMHLLAKKKRDEKSENQRSALSNPPIANPTCILNDIFFSQRRPIRGRERVCRIAAHWMNANDTPNHLHSRSRSASAILISISGPS